MGGGFEIAQASYNRSIFQDPFAFRCLHLSAPPSPNGAMRNEAAIRIGAVSYLNTVPLVEGLAEGHASEVKLSFDLPSRLADQLASGAIDVGLIPCIEFFQNPDYTILSDACIACRGPVWSVKLLSRTPFHAIRSLALDEGSRTSAALVRILLGKRYGLCPQLSNLPIAADARSTETDAVLIIGDRAMHTDAFEDEFPHQWDLGEQWRAWSGLSFVFAMWVGTADLPASRATAIERALAAARDRGIARLEGIASEQAHQFGLSESQCLHYLRDNLYFHLGDKERAGLRRFRELAHDLSLAPATSEPPWILEPC